MSVKWKMEPLHQRLGCYECTKPCRFGGSQSVTAPPTTKEGDIICTPADKYGCNSSRAAILG